MRLISHRFQHPPESDLTLSTLTYPIHLTKAQINVAGDEYKAGKEEKVIDAESMAN
jgi:hypothetical protein